MAEKLHEQTVDTLRFAFLLFADCSFSYAFLISVHLFAVFVIAIIVGKHRELQSPSVFARIASDTHHAVHFSLRAVFAISSYMVGIFVFSSIIGKCQGARWRSSSPRLGQVGNVITNRNASRLEFERLLVGVQNEAVLNAASLSDWQDSAKQYMRTHNVPSEMQRRVQRWYDYSWSRGRMSGAGDVHSIKLLPDKLKTELALHVNLGTLKKVDSFIHPPTRETTSVPFLGDHLPRMSTRVPSRSRAENARLHLHPGWHHLSQGRSGTRDVHHCWWRARSSQVSEQWTRCSTLSASSSDKNDVLTRLVSGDFFGEIGILNIDGANRRTADVRSVGYSELFSLSKEDVLEGCRDYPEAERKLYEYAQNRLGFEKAKEAAAEKMKGAFSTLASIASCLTHNPTTTAPTSLSTIEETNEKDLSSTSEEQPPELERISSTRSQRRRSMIERAR